MALPRVRYPAWYVYIMYALIIISCSGFGYIYSEINYKNKLIYGITGFVLGAVIVITLYFTTYKKMTEWYIPDEEEIKKENKKKESSLNYEYSN